MELNRRTVTVDVNSLHLKVSLYLSNKHLPNQTKRTLTQMATQGTKVQTTNKTNSTSSKSASKHEEGVEIDGGFIIITLPLLKKAKPCMKNGSATGNFNLATTSGFQWDAVDVDGYSTVGVSVNVIGKP